MTRPIPRREEFSKAMKKKLTSLGDDPDDRVPGGHGASASRRACFGRIKHKQGAHVALRHLHFDLRQREKEGGKKKKPASKKEMPRPASSFHHFSVSSPSSPCGPPRSQSRPWSTRATRLGPSPVIICRKREREIEERRRARELQEKKTRAAAMVTRTLRRSPSLVLHSLNTPCSRAARLHGSGPSRAAPSAAARCPPKKKKKRRRRTSA